MKKRRILTVLAVLVCGYVSGPYFAGSFQIGDRLGPVIYSRDFHEVLYRQGYENSYHEKPRMPVDTVLYNRPLFYGFPRRPKSAQERQAFLEKKRAENNPVLDRFIKMNEELEAGKR
jgi:hypothetical protein